MNLKIYHYYGILALLTLAIGSWQYFTTDEPLVLNYAGTYYIISNIFATSTAVLFYLLTAAGYWLVINMLKKKLIPALTTLHSIIIFGIFIVCCFHYGYTLLNPPTDPLARPSDFTTDRLLVISILLTVFIATPIYVLNIMIAIFKIDKPSSFRLR